MLKVGLTRFGGSDAFAAEECPESVPGPGEIRIRVRAVGFNPVDVKARRGVLGGTLPLMLGRDVSGVVDQVGEGVTRFRAGDSVYARANAAYLESVVVPAPLAAPMPGTLGFAQAAALPVVGFTAYQCVVGKARTGAGEAAFVAGDAGGVGSIAVQLLRHVGADPILVTAGSDSSAEYLERHLRIPPEHVVRYEGKSLEELADQVRMLALGRPIQAAFDLVGGSIKRLCFDVVGMDGHVVSIVEEPAGYDLNLWDERASPLVLRSASFHFVQLAARVTYGPRRSWDRYQHQLVALAHLIDSGAISVPPVMDVGPFSVEAVRRAHAFLEAGGLRGKVVASVASRP